MIELWHSSGVSTTHQLSLLAPLPTLIPTATPALSTILLILASFTVFVRSCSYRGSFGKVVLQQNEIGQIEYSCC